MKVTTISIIALLLGFEGFSQDQKSLVLPNENLITENIASISKEMVSKVKKYSESRGASLIALHPTKNEIIITTRFGSTNQLHQVIQPLGARKQITFFEEPVNFATYEPTKGEYLVYSKDIGGNEFGQLYKLDLTVQLADRWWSVTKWWDYLDKKWFRILFFVH